MYFCGDCEEAHEDDHCPRCGQAWGLVSVLGHDGAVLAIMAERMFRALRDDPTALERVKYAGEDVPS